MTGGGVGRRRIWMKVIKESYKLPVITRNIMYNMINIINTALCYIRKLLTVNPEFSSQGRIIIFFYLIWWGDGCLLNLVWSSFHDVSQTIMLYTLNLYSAVCQVFLNKTGIKRGKRIQKYYSHTRSESQGTLQKIVFKIGILILVYFSSQGQCLATRSINEYSPYS